MIQLLRYGVAISIGFGLGAAYVGFGFQAGLTFWVVMGVIAIVKIVIFQTYTAIVRRRDEPTWQDTLATTVSLAGPQSDRIAPSPRLGKRRPVPPM